MQFRLNPHIPRICQSVFLSYDANLTPSTGDGPVRTYTDEEENDEFLLATPSKNSPRCNRGGRAKPAYCLDESAA